MSLLLNQLQAKSVRLFTPWTGVPFADVEIALDETGVMPSGKCTLQIGDTGLFVGMIDDRASGTFAGSGMARVLVGGGGWGRHVDGQHFHGAVLSTVVYSATGAAVGETVIDVAPKSFGEDFVRVAGPASSVLDGVDWYVRPDGTTVVGPRVPATLDPTTQTLVSYDPLTKTAIIDSNDPIAPGTVLVDPTRFSGALTVRNVDQTWNESGARAICHVGDVGLDVVALMTLLIREKLGIAYLKKYRYRVVLQNPADETLVLQAVDRDAGAPDSIPLSMWPGMSGLGGLLTPGCEVLVGFVNGDPKQPVVTNFAKRDPLQLELSATLLAKLTAPIVQLGEVPEPIAKGLETVGAFMAFQAWGAAIASAEATLTAKGPTPSLTDCADYLHAFAAATATLMTALGATVGLIPATTIQGGP